MGKKAEDITGQRNGRLVVLERTEPANRKEKDRNAYWRCVCDCGKEVVVHTGNFKTCQSCGCLRKERGKTHPNYQGVGDLSLTYFNKLKFIANRRSITFDVNMQYLWNLFQSQNGRCPYTGLELTMPIDKHDLACGNRTASLDRIDSSEGYIAGNLQWVHKDINMMKQKYSSDYFVEMCKLVSENYNG